MKRYENLWGKIIDFQNLLDASKQAQKSKRYRDNVLAFNNQRERNLLKLRHELITKSYRPGGYRTFRIFDPKPRLISAAPYRDRVIHHALCNVIVPLLDKSLIDTTYANRTGYGTHRALKQFITLARSSRYILQCDISKYFPSIDHQILKAQLHHKIKCKDTLWLIDLIIDYSNPQEPVHHYFPGDTLLTPLERRHGLPIGNLTSQFFANFYLNGFDHFVKEQLHARKYLRYVDDYALFSNDYGFLKDAKVAIRDYLEGLRLRMHPIKSQLFETKYGANFVRFRILPDRVRVRNDNLRRARHRLKQLQQDYATGMISLADLQLRLQSWEAHLKHGDTKTLRRDIFSQYSFVRPELEE
ncbi:RNA-directed DNA polymerase (reverse transcriptase) [[Leptolyngbya] sp. PCC 7376]|uniref:RNA-directed DNA polymerase n=1 Tax=[Leptolyngbya] sp. PCC 7376 TaxID=111781 RepID=UPI00029F4ADB|nr:RNA-directed DNA polymerase [[Leptolyngbya] sp. PCC 7376]AFY39963.1 RNA-directed DNA polymerase (reverse transcriptase) [[Leptolyngbya] sp. PCC 7376]